jgi:hypothetical protein
MHFLSAIRTRYTGPTNSRGTRILATTAGNQRHFHHYNSALSMEENHAQAASELREKLKWDTGGELRGGWLNETDAVWVFQASASTVDVITSTANTPDREKYADRAEGQSIHVGDRLATWSLEHDHTGHIPKPERVWYLRCDECNEEIEVDEDGALIPCDCTDGAE